MSTEEKEELLREAQRRYPVGTKFISALDNTSKKEVKNGSVYWWKGEQGIVVDTSNGPSIWDNGNWAEITYLPKPEIINSYQIF